MTGRNPDPAPDLDPELVAAAVTRITGQRIDQVERLRGSVGNQDFMLSSAGGDLVLKASRIQDLEPEAWACQRVRREGVSAPEIIGLEADAHSLPLPFLLMRRLPGRPVEESSPALVAAGRQLAVVHSIRLDGYGALAVTGARASGTADGWSAVVAELLAGVDDLVAGQVLSESAVVQALARLEQAKDAMSFDGPAVLLHGDLKLLHLLATSDDQVGLIDFGDACAGDPRLDLARMSMAGPTALAAVLSGYGLELTPELSRTFACYRMVWNIDALTYEFRAGGDWFDPYRAGITAAVRELS